LSAAASWVPAINNLGALLARGAPDGSLAPDPPAAARLLLRAARAGSAAAWLNLGAACEAGLFPPSSVDEALRAAGGSCVCKSDHECCLCPAGRPAAAVAAAAAAAACYARSGTPAALLRLGLLHLRGGFTQAADLALRRAADADGGVGPTAAEALLWLARLQEGYSEAAEREWEGRVELEVQRQGIAACVAAAGSRFQAAGTSRRCGSGTWWQAPLFRAAGAAARAAWAQTTQRPRPSAAAVAARGAARALYERAARAGSAEAQHWLGCECWWEASRGGQTGGDHTTGGCGCGDRDAAAAAALEWWAAAAQQGHSDSLLALGLVAERGGDAGGDREPVGAVSPAAACCRAAAAQGCKPAECSLARLQASLVAAHGATRRGAALETGGVGGTTSTALGQLAAWAARVHAVGAS
jgi:TPR repeat protein